MEMEYKKNINAFIAMCRKYIENCDYEISLAKLMLNDKQACEEFYDIYPEYSESNIENRIKENDFILDLGLNYTVEWNMKNIFEFQNLLLEALFYLKEHCFFNKINNQYYSFEEIMNEVFYKMQLSSETAEDDFEKLRDLLKDNDSLTVKIINKTYGNDFSISIVNWNLTTIESVTCEIKKYLDSCVYKNQDMEINNLRKTLNRINELTRYVSISTKKDLNKFVSYYI